MSQVRFIGCLHLGHKWMATHRGFQDEFYHDDYIIKEWNKVVHKKDLTYILGDVTMESKKHYYKLNQLNGRKIVVMGNHDLHTHTRELLNYVESVAGMIDYKGFCLTHCPIHPAEISFYRGNIHAHIHENKLQEIEYLSKYGDPGEKIENTLHKYRCVDTKLINYQPKTLEELNKQSLNPPFLKTAVSSSNVHEGLKVIDIDGIIGTIKQSYDSHNVWVLYDNDGGSGFYCVDKSCDDYDPIYYC